MKKEENELVIIKLMSGDVVMGAVEMAYDSTVDADITFTSPMSLTLDPMRGAVGMMPYDAIFSQAISKRHTFKTNHIMHDIPVHEDFKKEYYLHIRRIEESEAELAVAEAIDTTDDVQEVE